MQATQPIRTVNPFLAALAAFALAALLVLAAVATAIVPSVGTPQSVTNAAGAGNGAIEVRRTTDDLYGAGNGAIEVRRTTDDLYGAPLVLDGGSPQGSGHRGSLVHVAQ